MLKERDEMDTLLPGLLLSMDVTPISRAQAGVRQHGVDVAAVGPDPDDEGKKKLFLMVIKQGDLDRGSWDSGTQAVRPSLNEIFDVYLPQHVVGEHEPLPKKIVVCCNGDMKQNVEGNWDGYRRQHAEPGAVEFDFWGGDKLATLVERHFLDEYLFPESARKKMRKTIALADQNEEEPHHFYSLVHETLFERDLPMEDTLSARRKRQHALRLLNLSLNIVFHWCREADNLRPALLCAERAVLLAWDWMRQGEVLDCQTTLKEFVKLFSTYLNVTLAYADKLAPLCVARDGMTGQWEGELEYPLRTLETVGVFGVLVMALTSLAAGAEDGHPNKQSMNQTARGCAEVLAALIKNNPAAATPRYDGHSIDVALGLLALTKAGLRSQAVGWLENLGVRIWFAYRTGHHFPISTDSYDDLVAMHFDQAPPKEKLMELSTLLPMLAHWYVALDLPEGYVAFRNNVVQTFTRTALQLWFPDDDTEDYLYKENAGFASGTTLAPIHLPGTLHELEAETKRLHEARPVPENLSCFSNGWSILGLIASRHFRTPVMTTYWRPAGNEPVQPKQE
jgi:hypothetical protein